MNNVRILIYSEDRSRRFLRNLGAYQTNGIATHKTPSITHNKYGYS